jgi:hypothetical protein
MQITEESMRFLEEHIPELANSAIKQAYWQALATGNSVLQYEEGAIYEVFPDGTRQLIKTLAPLTSVQAGQQVLIK